MSLPLKALLVDFRYSGHHLEYASNLVSELDTSGIDVEFLGPEPTERYTSHFDDLNSSYLFPDGRDFKTELQQSPSEARTSALRRVKRYAGSEHDIIHLLHMDDLIKEFYEEFTGDFGTPIVGTLNGAFFSSTRWRDAPLTLFSDRLFTPRIAPYLPARNNKTTLYRCFKSGILEHLFVPTDTAAEALDRYVPESVQNGLSVVPDPVNPWLEDLPDQATARRELGIPIDDPTLLYFGEMRFEKGVDLLCDALDIYDGPGFTMVLAGSTTDIDKRKLTNLYNPRITFDIRAEFVPEQDIPTLFSASDGVVFPYRRLFGEYRPSGVFQKACAAHLPVLAPDFGFFANQISMYNLGITFSAGDVHSLTEKLGDFVEITANPPNSNQLESYVSTQTYQNLATDTIDSYECVLSGSNQ